MRKEDLIAFARRDWAAIAEMKRRYWPRQKSRMTPLEALEVGDLLSHHMSEIRKDWPTEEERRADLASHTRLSEILRRVGTSKSR